MVIKMSKKYQISAEQKAKLYKARKLNNNKNIDKRLKALIMRAEGKKNAEIAEACEYNPSYVSRLVSIFCNQGINQIVENHYAGNRRNMSLEEEESFLSEYKKQVEQGQIIDISVIKNAYEEKVGHSIGKGQIYRVLNRHGWRKIISGSKKPNKAGEEGI